MRSQITTFVSALIFLFSKITFAQSWKNYPYNQPGSVINFPADEGFHPGEPIEWWYTNGHVIGDSTGTEYSFMLTYFYYPSLGFDGFRIFQISNESNGQFITETTPCDYPVLSQSHLEIEATTGFTGAGHEEWKTKKDFGNNLIPFQYQLNAILPNGGINFNYDAIKRPLMMCGTGYFFEGVTGYTYYYSQTKLDVSGMLTMNGITESVHGLAWIDRQWGQFNPLSGEKYTWMSLQLSNDMDINLWNIFNSANQVPDTTTYQFLTTYENDSIQNTVFNFNLDRLEYQYMSDSLRCYDKKWHLTFGNVDLTLTAPHSNNEILLPFRFFEGRLNISGTVNGNPVTGVGYVELLHSFAAPDIAIINPNQHINWNGQSPITWQLLNHDDGRPVLYDVELSTDSVNFTSIASNLTDTSFSWTPNIGVGTEGWFKIIGHSIDSTLVGIKVSDSSFIYSGTGINEINESQIIVSPNPFTEQFEFTFLNKIKEEVQIKIFNQTGELVNDISPSFFSDENKFACDLKNHSAGIYFYQVKTGALTLNGKLIKLK